MADPPRSFWNPNRLGASLGYTQLRYNRGYTQQAFGRAEGTHGRKYSSEKGFLFVYGTTVNNGRDALGRWTQWTSEQRWRNERMARRYQELVLENMAARIKRPKVSTGRLLEVTASPRNIGWETDWWGVGNEGYLNTSQAKYWRTIEEGTARVWKRSFIGDPLVGVFGESMLSDRHAGPPYTRPGVNRAGKFRPYGRELRRAIIASGAQVARVRRQIAPMNAYRDAWRQMGGGRDMAYDMTSQLPGVMGRNVRSP